MSSVSMSLYAQHIGILGLVPLIISIELNIVLRFQDVLTLIFQ